MKEAKESFSNDLKKRKEDIYGYSHRLKLVLTGPNGIRYSKNICEANKQTLFRYHSFLKARKLSLPRQEKLMKALKRLAELVHDKQFQSVARGDMERIVGNLKPKLKGSRKSELADSTLRDFQIIVRQFYAWLFRSPKRQYPEVVAWMEPKEPKPKLQATDLLMLKEPYVQTEEESKFGRSRGYCVIRLVRTGETYTWGLNGTTWDRLLDAFGEDSVLWVGKKVRLKLETQIVRGEDKTILYGVPYKEPQVQFVG